MVAYYSKKLGITRGLKQIIAIMQKMHNMHGMPTMPPSQCAAYHCKARTVRGSIYCSEHAPMRTEQTERRGMDKAYKSRAWEIIRTAQLTRAPLCAACMQRGVINSGEHVDHVFPWKLFGPHAFRFNLFQSLCGACHSTKGALERRGIFRHYTDPAPVDYCSADYPAAVPR